ncbi:hypothetical protein EIP86_002059 [Pleurotus ostreatoroseus]|nr:hypothetical protein EIP86_002059 [Pleurotus ostreatoroseus]
MQEATKDHDLFNGPPDEKVADPGTLASISGEAEAYTGVKTVEAAEKVYGKYSKWLLFLGLSLAAYVYSLDSCTTSIYLSYVASSFEEHSLISSIEIAQTVIMVDAGEVIFYIVGYIVVAAARNLGAVGAGIVLSSIGLQLLTAIIIADTTTLKWRGLVNALMAVPFIINGFVGANISTQVIENSTWRWGYGMFTILVPVSLSPLVFTLFWAERKARRLGLVEKALGRPAEQTTPSRQKRTSLPVLIWRWTEAFDLIGLVLLVVAVALILVPLTLSSTTSHGWHNGK